MVIDLNYIESFYSALQSIKGNKIRSFLTMLGIIIGISSVIAMSSIGKGGQESIIGDLKEGGYGKFTINIDRENEDFRWKYLLNENIIQVLKESGEFKGVSPNIGTVFSSKSETGRRDMIYFEVVNSDYEKIEKVDIIYGRNFLPFEYESGEKVILIDNIMARSYFGNEQNAIGKTIQLNKGRKDNPQTYRIVGVFQNKLESMIKMLGGGGMPKFGRLPLTTYQKMFDFYGKEFLSVLVEVKNVEEISESMSKAEKILENLTGIEGLYNIKIENNGAASFDNILSTLNIFVTFVAGISLFVGGIGVMNIMLVSVVERTKEIGIRKALGATNFNILLQFLMESIILTGIGGVSGVILGVLFALGIGKFIGIMPIFTLTTILTALIISMAIGIIFGVTPARKASKLNPVEALRTE